MSTRLSGTTNIGSSFTNISRLDEITHYTSVETIEFSYFEIHDDDIVYFSTLENLESVSFTDDATINTSDVISMSDMFQNCTNLTSIDLSGFDTSDVTSMSSMFQNCTNLTSLDLSGFDTSNVINMRNMFAYCIALTSIDLSGFDTSNVTNMRTMFEECTSLRNLDISSFNTRSVTNYTGIFGFLHNSTIHIHIGPNFRFVPRASDGLYDLFDEPGGDGPFGSNITFRVQDEDTRLYIEMLNSLGTENYDFKIVGGVAGADPYINPLYGSLYKLPDTESCYRLLQTKNIIVNAQVQAVDQQYITSKVKDTIDMYFHTVDSRVCDWESMYFFTKLAILYNDEVCIYNMLEGVCESTTPDWISLNLVENNTCLLAMYSGEPALKTYLLNVADLLVLETAIYDNPQVLTGVKIHKLQPNTDGLLIRRYSSTSSQVDNLYDSRTCKFLPALDNNVVTEIFYTNNGTQSTRQIVVV